jgi:tetratricopeptide (TPR) repeat protein
MDPVFSSQNIRSQLVLVAGAIALLYPWIGCNVFAGETEAQICDIRADYALGIEDYPEAIRLHAEVVRRAPQNALAHYHLGFAQGEMGNRTAEISEYQRAATLGLRNWDLFLNLGLAQSEDGELHAATDSLQRAVLLGGEHWESHFDLAVVEARRGMLADAEHEALLSLRLNPGQPDARNLVGVIYTKEGKTIRASLIWRELVRDLPDYEPARKNLALLGSQNEVAFGKTAAAALPTPAAAVKAINNASRPRQVFRNTAESKTSAIK